MSDTTQPPWCGHTSSRQWCPTCLRAEVERLRQQVEAAPPSSTGTVFTSDVVGIHELLARLARCDGKAADAAVVGWEHCQLIVAEVERLRKQVDDHNNLMARWSAGPQGRPLPTVQSGQGPGGPM